MGDQQAATYTGQHEHRINTHNINIHALSAIQTHDPSVRALHRSATVIDYKVDCIFNFSLQRDRNLTYCPRYINGFKH
jgi:methylglyoxal synthase